MKIAIDARYYGKSGIGRVLSGILDNLPYNNHEFYLIGSKDLEEKYPNAHLLLDETNPFSKSGIVKFNKEFNAICDAILIPNFIIPFGIKIPIYSYVHDLLFLDMPSVSTKGFIDYKIKKYLFKRCFKKANKIFCVSEFTIGRCNHYFPKYSNKLVLNYPGLSKEVIEYADTHEVIKNKENSIVYVGNVKPHKGIDILLEAFGKLNDETLTLKIIGQKENFLVGTSFDENKYSNVIFTGRISDEELLDEISKAKYLVQPSRYEGFGIPPLEALYLGTIPLVSNIDVFKEVYGGLPVVFFENSLELEELLKANVIVDMCSRGYILKKYNYKTVVEVILAYLIGV